MITARDFCRKPAFSFTTQPDLGALFDAVRDQEMPLCVVTGAGVSIDSSLPTWVELVERIASRVTNEQLRRVASSATSGDITRQAETLFALIRATKANPARHEIVRDALFLDEGVDVEYKPGQLAGAVARLAEVTRGRVRLLTTNYDDMLEQALHGETGGRRVRSVGLGAKPQWERSSQRQSHEVFHLHGMVRRGEQDPLRPLILTQSDYLEHGGRVRSVLQDAMHGACTIFVGVSMTDPNLIGSLHEVTSKGSHRAPSPKYLFVVPDLTLAEDDEVAASYAIESARFLESKLDVKPIFLKSYAQLTQVVADLALAAKSPASYDDIASPTLRYGPRFSAALNDCYAAVGYSAKGTPPEGSAARRLSDRLYEELHAESGPASHLASMDGPDDELFALFLWLRSRPKSARSAPPFKLSLVGSSAYSHRNAWSAEREVGVADAEAVPALAAFTGRVISQNLVPAAGSNVWRGTICVPITVNGTTGVSVDLNGQNLERLTVGVISLNTTKFVFNEPQRGIVADSALFTASNAEIQPLYDKLLDAAEHLLYPTKPSSSAG